MGGRYVLEVSNSKYPQKPARLYHLLCDTYEYGVLSLMAQHPGKLFTKEQIFEAVWHKDSESYLRAVTSTIGRIRQKIEDDKDHPRYIKTVSNIGYQFVPSSESVRLNRNL